MKGEPHTTDSVATRALEVIKAKGSVRTREIAQAINEEPKIVSAALTYHVRAGTLVSCIVQVPGQPPQNEYRLSTAPGAYNPLRAMSRGEYSPPAPEHRVSPPAPSKLHLNAEAAARAKEESAPASAASSPAQPAIDEQSRRRPALGSCTAFRCTLSSDGRMSIALRDGTVVVLDSEEARTLIDFIRAPGDARDARLPAFLARQAV